MLLVAQPYLALRLVEDFRRVPRPLVLAGIAGMVISWGALIVDAPPLHPPVSLAIVGYFLVLEGYAVVAFVGRARATRAVSRWRHGMAAVGSARLAAAILLAGIVVVVPQAGASIALIRAVIPVLAAVAYYLGFVPPGWFRRAWQLPEVRRVLRTVAGQPARERAPLLLRELCTVASHTSGGMASVALLWREEQRRFSAEASDAPALQSVSFTPDDGPVSLAWNQRRADFVKDRAHLGAAGTELAGRVGATALLVVPLATPRRAWGMLVVLQLRGSLFPSDDLDLLEILTEQCAIALENAALVKEQERLTMEQGRLVAHLEAVNKELQSFSYSIPHDLRAPLREIDGFSQALMEDYPDKLDEKGVGYLGYMRAASQRMGQLIDDLLKLSRVTRSELRSEQVDLSAVASGVAETLQRQEPARQVRFLLQPGISAQGDPGLLQIAVENLLDNAWKFTAKHASVSLRFSRTEVSQWLKGMVPCAILTE